MVVSRTRAAWSRCLPSAPSRMVTVRSNCNSTALIWATCGQGRAGPHAREALRFILVQLKSSFLILKGYFRHTVVKSVVTKDETAGEEMSSSG